jgi:hypothetical protein
LDNLISSIERFREVVSLKNPDLEGLAEMIMDSGQVLPEALANLTQKDETVRYNSFRALKILAETRPELLYPHWDVFVTQLRSQNSYHILSGLHLIADLTAIDGYSRFEKIFPEYYDLMSHKNMVIITHVALASGRILLYKPSLRKKVENKLLGIDTYLEHQKHRDLIKAGVLEAFLEAVKVLTQRDKIRRFALPLIDSADSPKCRKLARTLLDKI